MRKLPGIVFKNGQMISHRIKAIDAAARTDRVGKYRRRISSTRPSIDHEIARRWRDTHRVPEVEILASKQIINQTQAVNDVSIALVFEIQVLQLAELSVQRQLTRCRLFERQIFFELLCLAREFDRQPHTEVAGEPERDQIKIKSLRHIVIEKGKRPKQTFGMLDEPIEVKGAIRGPEFLRMVDAIVIEPSGVKIVQIRVQFERGDRLSENQVVKGLC